MKSESEPVSDGFISEPSAQSGLMSLFYSPTDRLQLYSKQLLLFRLFFFHAQTLATIKAHQISLDMETTQHQNLVVKCAVGQSRSHSDTHI